MRHLLGFQLRQLALMTALLGVTLGTARAGGYSNIYFFGDRLTDSGTFQSVVGVNDHFSTHPGAVWSQNPGVRCGQSVTPGYTASLPSPYTFTQNASGNSYYMARWLDSPGAG
jgi:phospholipase/lecithinase/hemolysin